MLFSITPLTVVALFFTNNTFSFAIDWPSRGKLRKMRFPGPSDLPGREHILRDLRRIEITVTVNPYHRYSGNPS